MMATIQVNERGTLTLPKAFRKAMGIDRGGTVAVELADGGIVLRPSISFPIEIYSDDRIREFEAADVEIGRILKRKRK